MTKALTKDDLMLASLKMLASIYSLTGEADIGETLTWAVDRIEYLEHKRGAHNQGCTYCSVAAARKATRSLEGSNVIPFRRD